MRDQIVVIGNFDGVHRGHEAVLVRTESAARERGVGCSVLTFDPHPAVALGRTAPPLLTTLERKLELIRRSAPALVPVVQRFDAAFASQTPEAFAADVLVGTLGAKTVVVGKNFRFGRGRAGDFDELTRLGERMGFETRFESLKGDEAGVWSSSRIRKAIAEGDLDEATRMLGRPHMISGIVMRGDQRGRTIGFPTANIAETPEALPPNGVYAVLVDRADGAPVALAKGVANVGLRPTVKTEQKRPLVEVHLFDFDGNLYGAKLRVHVVARLREERKFGGLDELKAQIARDAETARERLSAEVPDAQASGAFH